MNLKPKHLFLTILISLLACSQIGNSGFQGNIDNLPVYVDAPSPYSYIIDTNSTHYFAFNGTTKKLDDWNTNKSVVINNCIGNMTTGNIWIKAGIDCSDLKLIAHPLIAITGETGFLNAGASLLGYNGSWIAHGLAGDPGTTGSITLSLRGSTTYNATMILRVPTVLQSNSTHFQIEFNMWETVTWTQVPVTIVEAQTVYWITVFKP